MSVQAMSWVFEHETQTSGTARLVLLSIANHAGAERWESYPSLETIAREANVSRRETVRVALRKLEELGVIETIVQGAFDERIRADKRPNLYRMIVSNGPPDNDPPRNERPPASRADGPPESARAAPRKSGGKPSIEPSINPQAAEARAIATAVWENRTPKPAQPFIAALKIFEKLLNAGWTPRQIETAAMSVPTISVGTMEMALAKTAPARRARDEFAPGGEQWCMANPDWYVDDQGNYQAHR